MPESSLTLASIAILRVDLDTQHRDYLSYLTPFVLAALKGQANTAISDTHVRNEIKIHYGLVIPESVIQLILKRLARRGILTRSMGVFHVSGPLPVSDIDAKRETARLKINSVIQGLVKYAMDKYNLHVHESAASDALLSLFRQFGVSYLTAFIQQSAIPEVSQASEGLQLATCSYIAQLHKRDDSDFQELVVMLKGVLLSNALLCSDLDSIQKNFKHVTFYLDTPILLGLLGLHGSRAFTLAYEMVVLLRDLKGTVAYLGHTLEEATKVIQFAIDSYDQPEYHNRIIDQCRREGKGKSDIILVQNKAEDILADFGLERHSTPKEMVDYMVIDESELEIAVKDEITYMNPRALYYDIDSIRSIYALRKGKKPRRLEDCPAIFVTSNVLLAKAAAEYGRHLEPESEVSAVITDFSLSNVAWLKAPRGAPEIPETELLLSPALLMS